MGNSVKYQIECHNAQRQRVTLLMKLHIAELWQDKAKATDDISQIVWYLSEMRANLGNEIEVNGRHS